MRVSDEDARWETRKVLLVFGAVLALGTAAFVLSPFWSMARAVQALCNNDVPVMEKLIDFERLGPIKGKLLKTIVVHLDCPNPKDTQRRSLLGRMLRIHRQTDTEWLDVSCMRVRYFTEKRGPIATALLEREVLRWRLVDLNLRYAPNHDCDGEIVAVEALAD